MELIYAHVDQNELLIQLVLNMFKELLMNQVFETINLMNNSMRCTSRVQSNQSLPVPPLIDLLSRPPGCPPQDPRVGESFQVRGLPEDLLQPASLEGARANSHGWFFNGSPLVE